MESICIRGWSGPCLVTFWVTTGTCSANLHTLPRCGKSRTRKKLRTQTLSTQRSSFVVIYIYIIINIYSGTRQNMVLKINKIIQPWKLQCQSFRPFWLQRLYEQNDRERAGHILWKRRYSWKRVKRGDRTTFSTKKNTAEENLFNRDVVGTARFGLFF